jgi:hypothetical protein
MLHALIALCCVAAVHPPLAQNWSDTGLIRADDDWSDVAAIVGYRGDALVEAPGTDPREVVADGSRTPVDVSANRTDPDAIGLAAGVAEFELPNPVVALRGSATAGAPQLVLSLDTRGRAGIEVRLTLRDLDDAADSVQPIAVQYRVGDAGRFANVAGGYVADATASAQSDLVGSAQAERRTPVHVVLPRASDDRPLVQVRVLTTDAVGRDEWVGVDDIEVTAGAATPAGCDPPDGDPPDPNPSPKPVPDPAPDPRPGARPTPEPTPIPDPPDRGRPRLTALTLMPNSFEAAARGRATSRTARRPVVRAASARESAGTALSFRLSESATVRFRVTPGGERFRVRGRRGLNRVRFSGRIRGRSLGAGGYSLTAIAADRDGLRSAPRAVPFRIERPQG